MPTLAPQQIDARDLIAVQCACGLKRTRDWAQPHGHLAIVDMLARHIRTCRPAKIAGEKGEPTSWKIYRTVAAANPNPFNVQVGQVWRDYDIRFRDRTLVREIRVLAILQWHALVENTKTSRKTTVALKRFRPSATGYRLVSTPKRFYQVNFQPADTSAR